MLPGPTVRVARRLYRSTVALIPYREELPVLLNRRRLFGCGAEVGVARGDFSADILRGWQGAHLISVDPWREAPAGEYVDLCNVSQDTQERLYERTTKLLEQFGERSSIWRMSSVDASQRVPSKCLDFVYIDARHEYEYVKEDLHCWFDKVRPGGLIAGHDYMDGRVSTGLYGVKRAVDEFFAGKGLPVATTFRDPETQSWVVEVAEPGGSPSPVAWALGSLLRRLLTALVDVREGRATRWS